MTTEFVETKAVDKTVYTFYFRAVGLKVALIIHCALSLQNLKSLLIVYVAINCSPTVIGVV